MNTREKMIAFAYEIRGKLNEGLSLKEIGKWSYDKREAGDGIPYLSVADSETGGITRLVAMPTKKEKELYAFFDETAPGCKALKRYTLEVGKDYVNLWERTSRENKTRLHD